jgi:hypothetical protein
MSLDALAPAAAAVSNSKHSHRQLTGDAEVTELLPASFFPKIRELVGWAALPRL